MSAPVRVFHSPLRDGIERFLAHKRALARRFEVEEKTLALLDRYLVQEQVTCLEAITPERINAFLASRPRKRPRSYNHLLGTVRRLFAWMVEQGYLQRSPVQAEPRRETSQRIPFIFDRQTARRLLELASGLKENGRAPLRAMTYRTIFALLYGLGLRVSEAARLSIADVDFNRRLLVIRETKFSKSRLVPFGPRMGQLLEVFVQARIRRHGKLCSEGPLFSFNHNRPLNACTISHTFHALMPRLNLQVPPGTTPPRLHHLRHSFAVGTLLRWYRSGLDPSTRLLHLATFLGHVDPTSTAVYLTITQALLQEANQRFEAFARPLLQEGGTPCD